MVTFRSIVIFMVLAAFLSMGVACSSNEDANKVSGAAKESQPAAEAKKEEPGAVSENKAPAAPLAPAPAEVAKEETPAPTAPSAPEPKTLALTGKVEKVGENMILSTDLGDYIIAGQDLSQLVGKTVNVTGAVKEAGGQPPTINIISFSEE